MFFSLTRNRNPNPGFSMTITFYLFSCLLVEVPKKYIGVPVSDNVFLLARKKNHLPDIKYKIFNIFLQHPAR